MYAHVFKGARSGQPGAGGVSHPKGSAGAGEYYMPKPLKIRPGASERITATMAANLRDASGAKNLKVHQPDAIPRTDTQEKAHQKELDSENWHTRTMAQMKDKSSSSLEYIRRDAQAAAVAAKDLGNGKAEGKYLDEVHYASMELAARVKHRAKKSEQASTLAARLGCCNLCS